jgi:hypothetical protein
VLFNVIAEEYPWCTPTEHIHIGYWPDLHRFYLQRWDIIEQAQQILNKVALEILIWILLFGTAELYISYTDCTPGNGHCAAPSKTAQVPSLSCDKLTQDLRLGNPWQ